MAEKVYLVIQWRDGDECPEDQGVFSTEEKAIAACHGPSFGYCEFTLDEELPIETFSDDDAWIFPLNT